jgi:antirestriction protein
MSECNSCGSNEIETKMTGEEWIIADYEGIPARYVGTYDLDSDYFEYKKALEESGMTADAFNAGISCGLNPNEIVDAYQGEYSNDEDFAIHCADGMGVFDEAAAWPYSCIDWERAAREIMDDFTVENGHYFSLT